MKGHYERKAFRFTSTENKFKITGFSINLKAYLAQLSKVPNIKSSYLR